MKKSISNKLTSEDRRLLWEMRKEQKRLQSELAKITNEELAKKMDVDVSTIDNLFSGRTYRNEWLERTAQC